MNDGAWTELTESIAASLSESVVSAKSHLTNITAAVGIEASPDAIVWGALISMVGILLLMLAVARTVSVLKRREHLRQNALAVRMAETAPDDDCDEHEVEVREYPRSAAPGDSDFEEDTVTGKR